MLLVESLMKFCNKKRGTEAYTAVQIKDAGHFLKELKRFGRPATHIFMEYNHLDHHILVKNVQCKQLLLGEDTAKPGVIVTIEFMHSHPSSIWSTLTYQDRCAHLDYIEYVIDDQGVRLTDNNKPLPASYFPLLQQGKWYMVKDKRYPHSMKRRQLAVNRALKMIDTGHYNFLLNNCEHFVTQVMLGCGISYQTGVDQGKLKTVTDNLTLLMTSLFMN